MSMDIAFTRDVDTLTPLDTATSMSPNCRYEYNAEQDATGVNGGGTIGDVNVVTEEWPIVQRVEAVFGIGHMHTGAINVSVWMRKGSHLGAMSYF